MATRSPLLTRRMSMERDPIGRRQRIGLCAMTPTLRRVLPTLLAVPALALSACGSSDEDKIKDIVKDVDKDATALCDNATEKLLVSVGGTVDKCKAVARGYKDQ